MFCLRVNFKENILIKLFRFIQFKAHNDGEFLYNPELLKNLDWSSTKTYLSPPITNEKPGENWLLVRPLQRADYNLGYTQLLSQLTSVGNVSKAAFYSKYKFS